LTKGRPPEADTLHSLYPLSVVLTHKKIPSQDWQCTTTTQQ